MGHIEHSHVPLALSHRGINATGGQGNCDQQPPRLPPGAGGETPLRAISSNSANMKHARRGEKRSHDLRCNELPAQTDTGVAVSFWQHRALTSREKQHAGSSQEWERSLTRFGNIPASPLINSSPQGKHAPAAQDMLCLRQDQRHHASSSHKTHVRPQHAKPLKAELLSSSGDV